MLRENTPEFTALLAKLAEDNGLSGLSMGMSDDFELAIEEGATIVRVGRALFGERSAAPGLDRAAGHADAANPTIAQARGPWPARAGSRSTIATVNVALMTKPQPAAK